MPTDPSISLLTVPAFAQMQPQHFKSKYANSLMKKRSSNYDSKSIEAHAASYRHEGSDPQLNGRAEAGTPTLNERYRQHMDS